MKIIKVEKCRFCYECLVDAKCNMYCDRMDKDLGNFRRLPDNFIHQDCPLEDYLKTTWQPISELEEICKTVWLLDKNNLVAKGQLVGFNSLKEQVFSFNLSELPEKFGTPVMFSESER